MGAADGRYVVVHDREHPFNDILDRQIGRIDINRVGRDQEWRDRTRPIGLVAGLERLRHRVDARRASLAGGVRGVFGAPTRALRGCRVEIELHIRVRKHNGADVAPFHHQRPGAGVTTLAVDKHRANLRMSSDRRRRSINFGRPNVACHIVTVDSYARVKIECRTRGHKRDRVAVGKIDALARGFPRDRAIHRAGINMPRMQSLGYSARDGSLSSARWAVDGDDHGAILSINRTYRTILFIALLPHCPIKIPRCFGVALCWQSSSSSRSA